MNNHCCRFAQKTWRQNDGGSIGKQLTGEVVDVVMSRWAGEFKKVARDATKDIMTKFLIDSSLFVDDFKLVFLSSQLAADGMRKIEKWLLSLSGDLGIGLV